MSDRLTEAKNRLDQGEIDAAQYRQIVTRLAQSAPPERWWPSALTIFGGLAVVGGGSVWLTSLFWAEIASQLSVPFVLGGIVAVIVVIAVAIFAFINGI